MTMKKQIIYMVCATALLSSCHIYKAYERPDSIDATGIYRDPVSETDTLASADTTNMGNLPWKEVFRDPKLQALIEEGLANNVDMQAAVLRVEEAKVLLTSARLSFLAFYKPCSPRYDYEDGKQWVCKSLHGSCGR